MLSSPSGRSRKKTPGVGSDALTLQNNAAGNPVISGTVDDGNAVIPLEMIGATRISILTGAANDAIRGAEPGSSPPLGFLWRVLSNGDDPGSAQGRRPGNREFFRDHSISIGKTARLALESFRLKRNQTRLQSVDTLVPSPLGERVRACPRARPEGEGADGSTEVHSGPQKTGLNSEFGVCGKPPHPAPFGRRPLPRGRGDAAGSIEPGACRCVSDRLGLRVRCADERTAKKNCGVLFAAVNSTDGNSGGRLPTVPM